MTRTPLKRKASPRKRRMTRRRLEFPTAGTRIPSAKSLRVRSGMGQVSMITRHVQKATIDTKAGGSFTGALKFTLGDLPGYADLGLYDQYMIDKVRVYFTFQCEPSAVAIAGNSYVNYAPELFTAIDLDDATTPTVNQVLQHDSCKYHGVLTANGGYRKRDLVPQVSVLLYQGLTSGYGAKTNQWIDTSTHDVEHYGLKYVLSNCGVYTNAAYVVINCIYYLKLRMLI